jgi:hypothetical protein
MRMTSGSGAEKPPSTVIAVELARSFRAKGHNVSDGAASFISLTERPMSAVNHGWAGVAVRGRFLRALLKTASEGEDSSPITRWRLVSAVDQM